MHSHCFHVFSIRSDWNYNNSSLILDLLKDIFSQLHLMYKEQSEINEINVPIIYINTNL